MFDFITPLFDFHHTTLSQIALVATVFLVCIAIVVHITMPDLFTGGNGTNAAVARNDELEVRLAVAKSYTASCLGYIKALEDATAAMLDLQSQCWKATEKREMTESHELLADRTRSTVAMFTNRRAAKKSS
jgi:hypothetical protein